MFRVFFIIMLMLPSIVCADLYQWTDENGVKHFSNTSPGGNTENMRQIKAYDDDGRKNVDRLQKTIDLYNNDPTQDTTNRIKNKNVSPTVVMYTTPTCGYCHRAKAYFSEHDIRFTEHDIGRSKQARRAFNALNGRGVPLIVIGDQQITGFNPSAINRALGLR